MAEFTILTSPFFTEGVLPFLLVFVLVYAILQRSKILGDNDKTNVILAIVIGFIFVTFSYAVDITTRLMGILGIAAVVILCFMLLLGFVYGENFKMNKGLRVTFGILIGITLTVSMLVITGYWDYVLDAATGGSGSNIVATVIFIAIIVGAIFLVTEKKKHE